MGVVEDLTDMTFNHLKVVERGDNYIQKSGKHRVMWLCKCDCGNPELVAVRSDSLKNGHIKSCGCIHDKRSVDLGKSRKKYNTYDLSGEYGIGYTSNGDTFYFDLEDYDKIKDYCWYISKTGYVISQDSEHKAIRMHRLVMNVTDSKVLIDHIYHNKTDNRKSQLRIVSASQNSMNTVRRKDNTSGVTGVSLDNNRWSAQITCDGKLIRLGRFNTFDEAVSARKLAEEKYFGEYAYTE